MSDQTTIVNGKKYKYQGRYTKPFVEKIKLTSSLRSCLKCDNKFVSISIENRICEKCKTRAKTYLDE